MRRKTDETESTKSNPAEKTVSKSVKQTKKTTATAKSPAKSPTVPFDNSVAYAAKRFALHLFLSVIFIFVAAAIYFLSAKVFTLLPISASTCQKCFCYDCKLPTYKSDEKSWTETETQSRDSYSDGTRVGFSDGSSATIGGGWSKETKSRAVNKQCWTQHITCKWCGNRTEVQESDEQHGKWSKWN